MSIVIEIDGLDEALKLTDPSRILLELDKGVNRATEMLRDQAKKMPPVSAARTGYGAHGIPVDTGRMRQSIQKRKLGLLAAEVYIDTSRGSKGGTNYAEFVHEGTENVPARPFLKWLLEEFEGKTAAEEILRSALERAVTP